LAPVIAKIRHTALLIGHKGVSKKISRKNKRGRLQYEGTSASLLVVSLSKALNEIASTFEWLDW